MSEKSQSQITEAINRVLERGSIAGLATLIDAPRNIGWKLLFDDQGVIAGSLGDTTLDQEVRTQGLAFLAARDEARTFAVAHFAPHLTEWNKAQVLFERLQPDPHLVICGAGHVGAALARLSAVLGYRTTLIDDRAEFVSKDRFPDGRITLITADNWANSVIEAVGNGRGVSVAIVTRGHNEDEECIRALADFDLDYIGLIGSKRRTNIVLDRLADAGASETFRKRVRAPIGLDLAAITPEEVALSILAEIVLERRGGKGGSLSEWRRSKKDS